MFTTVLDLEVLKKATILRFTDVTYNDTGDGTKWDGVGGIPSFAVSLAEIEVTDPNGSSYTVDCTADINAAWPVTAGEDIVFDDIEGEFVDGFYTVVYNVWMTPAAFPSVEDYSATIPGAVLFNAPAHGLVTGMKVTIAGLIGTYDGNYDAVRVNDNQFYIIHAWTVTDSGDATPYYSNTFSPFVFANVEMAIDRMLAVFCNMDESSEGDDYLKQVMLLKGLLMALRSAIVTTTADRINNIYGRITRILDFNSIELTYT
jgi:hypothetical protein